MTAQASADILPSALSFRSLGKVFHRGRPDEIEVLRDISVEVPEGQFLAILGASGCGKSTLLNILAGLEQTDLGSVVRQDPDSHIGYVFQDDRLLPWRTARGNVEFALEPLRLTTPERRRRALEALTLVGLPAFADRYPFQLSGGMRSRVAIARSLVRRPHVLLLDEPFSRLDGPTRTALHDELLQLKQSLAMTVVMVTHDVDEAVALADRVVVLSPRPGRIRRIIDVRLDHPRNPYGSQENLLARHLRQMLQDAHDIQEVTP